MAKYKRKIKTENPIAYHITDAKYGMLEVKNSANAWWLERRKLEDFILAKKIGGNDTIACFSAGITRQQLYYFLSLHPEFSTFFQHLEENPKLRALTMIYSQLNRDVDTAKWYLERKMKREFSARTELTGGDGKDLFAVSDEQAKKMALNSLAAIEERKKIRAKLKKNDGK